MQRLASPLRASLLAAKYRRRPVYAGSRQAASARNHHDDAKEHVAVAPTNSAPLNGLDPILKELFQAKARKNLTFESIAKSIGRDEIWVASVFYGQAKPLPKDIDSLSDLLDLDKVQFQAESGDQWWPNRGAITPMPPTDPVLYRLYEGVMVYGPSIKACLHEKFGDGIISMIDCKVHLERKADPKGDRAVLTFDGKFLPYSTW